MNIIGTTCLKSIFYATFKFLFQKQKKDFTWFLTILCTLYKQLDLKDSKVIITDQDIELIAAISKVFLYITNLLYL